MSIGRRFATSALVLACATPVAHAQAPASAPYHQCVQVTKSQPTTMPGIPSTQRLITSHASFEVGSGIFDRPNAELIVSNANLTGGATHHLPITWSTPLSTTTVEWYASVAIRLIVDPPKVMFVFYNADGNSLTNAPAVFCVSGELVPL